LRGGGFRKKSQVSKRKEGLIWRYYKARGTGVSPGKEKEAKIRTEEGVLAFLLKKFMREVNTSERKKIRRGPVHVWADEGFHDHADITKGNLRLPLRWGGEREGGVG